MEHISPASKAQFYVDRNETGSIGSDFDVICKAAILMEYAIKTYLDPHTDRVEAHNLLVQSVEES